MRSQKSSNIEPLSWTAQEQLLARAQQFLPISCRFWVFDPCSDGRSTLLTIAQAQRTWSC
jgi:hypothetical protein